MLTRMFSAAPFVSRPLMGGGVALALLATPIGFAPAHADSTTVFNCVGSFGSVSCVRIRGPVVDPHVRRLHPRDPKEEAASAERERKWVARCRPVLKEDRYGVSRYEYAARGCEFGKTQD
jgi:hypothetical protein